MGNHIKYKESTELKFMQLLENAKAPQYGLTDAAGIDLFSAKAMIIPPRDRVLVPTDIAVELPKGTYGRIAPRLGMAVKYFIGIGGGVIDFDFTGNIGIILFNNGDEPFKVQKGDRIAQLIIEKISQPLFVEVNEIRTTERGKKGFGSTGL